jgi:molybdate transport system substrate-binding protein
MTRRVMVPLLAVLAWMTAPAAGQTPLRVFVSNGVKTVIDDIRPQWEHAAGRSVALEFGTTAALKEKIEGGASFDATVLTSDAIADLVKAGKVAGGSQAEIARCGIGLGARAGTPKPDIRTADALKRTLQNAKSVTFAEAGASRKSLEKMFAQFGIADQMKARTVLTPSSVKSNELVRDGKAQYILTLVSEILPARGVELAGPLPESVQDYIHFAAGVAAKTSNAEAAKALVAYLQSSAAAPVFKAKGLEPR